MQTYKPPTSILVKTVTEKCNEDESARVEDHVARKIKNKIKKDKIKNESNEEDSSIEAEVHQVKQKIKTVTRPHVETVTKTVLDEEHPRIRSKTVYDVKTKTVVKSDEANNFWEYPSGWNKANDDLKSRIEWQSKIEEMSSKKGNLNPEMAHPPVLHRNNLLSDY